MRLHLLDKYSNRDAFLSLNEMDISHLKDEISPLIISLDEDELAKRFDYLMYAIQFAYLEKDQWVDQKEG